MADICRLLVRAGLILAVGFPDNVGGMTPLAPRDEAFRLWLKVGLLNFGGPAGQIALMHRLVVEEIARRPA